MSTPKTSQPISGTEGYADEADELLVRYERMSFADTYAGALHLPPKIPGRVLDIGSGTGRDAAALAALGHKVLAVEPTDELRIPAIALHPSPLIRWLKDWLPELSATCALGETFDLIMLTAVWMHLDIDQRRAAMPVIASLLADQGTVVMTLRHGPVPHGRRMFEVTAEETMDLARTASLECVLRQARPSITRENRLAGVTWTRLAFARR